MLRPLFELASCMCMNGNVISMRCVGPNSVLIRHWKGTFTPKCVGLTQIDVPGVLGDKLLLVAHDILSSGHLGTQKSLDRLLRHF